MGRDVANPLACILSGSLLLGYLAEQSGQDQLNRAAEIIESAVYTGFSSGRLRPLEFGGNQGTRAVAQEVINLLPTVG
jgi:3-isopropylmalate dehydrogenase